MPEHRILSIGQSTYQVGGLNDVQYLKHWQDHPNFVAHANCQRCKATVSLKYKRDALFDALTMMMLEDPTTATDSARRAA